ncbi:GNAT family N-acetyltransferase [Streptomyces sp. NBC_00859]|uniref:GNAT family N-acetyltransferase n=1 Tax=Streptomyces sp. NBC_00859 TaxID=2903682 RepID=UPI00386B66A1|nr:GNAT family N-acetyltransferase [Streptomyces sp. NBC_00859]
MEQTEFIDSGAAAKIVQQGVTTWTLRMSSPGQLRPVRSNTPMRVERSQVPSIDLSRALYAAVGSHVCWTDRFAWSHETWEAWVQRESMGTWIATVHGTVAGFFELEAQPGGAVEIVLFGLLPQFYGQGLGGALLTACVEQAWRGGIDWGGPHATPASHVFLRTSTLDHRHAVRNYLARGFETAEAETSNKRIPDPRMAPWPLPRDPRQVSASDR